ncbi:hypothetical protein P3T76_012731 [Phytophthora citrophthora]|uniref:RxLR effector protein n=1 Tax=Phytophthora citrophthora TaxID=4793 RepID=A0AAD9G433_9STRA|nr:hypothetical protein P3T76_012731 [Phytophthora citrophthora]
MRLSFIVLLAAAMSSLIATGHALPQEQSTVSRVSAAIPDQAVTGGQPNEKRFLRSAGVGRQMLKSDSFKKTKFNEWLNDNVSSFTVFIDKLGGKEKYRGLYNEYAALHKKSGKYP